MLLSDVVILEAQENYNKRSFRNRFRLLSDKGLQTFSIPLKKGKNEQQSIREVMISYEEDWPTLLDRTLKTFYGSSPFYEHYIPRLHRIIHSGESRLWNFNYMIIKELIKVLSLPVSLACSTTYEFDSADFADLRSAITPKVKFEHKAYPQVFEDKIGFIPNMSILDLLFALGPEARNFLLTSSMSCQL